MENFIQQATRTESPNFYMPNARILHAAMGCVTESAELMDALKKQVFYGKDLDMTNVKEEAGDILWYLAILFDELETSFDEEERRVIAKLQARFPSKFSEEDALNRNLVQEREILENKYE